MLSVHVPLYINFAILLVSSVITSIFDVCLMYVYISLIYLKFTLPVGLSNFLSRNQYILLFLLTKIKFEIYISKNSGIICWKCHLADIIVTVPLPLTEGDHSASFSSLYPVPFFKPSILHEIKTQYFNKVHRSESFMKSN